MNLVLISMHLLTPRVHGQSAPMQHRWILARKLAGGLARCGLIAAHRFGSELLQVFIEFTASDDTAYIHDVR